MTSSTSLASMPISLSRSAGFFFTSRPRCLPTVALNPVSITIGLPPIVRWPLSSSGMATQTK